MLTALKSSLLSLTSGSSSTNRRRTNVDTSTSYPGASSHDDDIEGDEYAQSHNHPNQHPYGGGRSPGLSSNPHNNINAATAAVGSSVPRVKHTITRIKANVKKLNPELLDTLSYPATSKQLAQLQKILQDYVIPKDVLDAYSIHDGQDSFSVPHMGDNPENEGNVGFIYGLWWMSIDEILEEYAFWRRLDVSNPPSPVASRRLNDIKGKGRQQDHLQRNHTSFSNANTPQSSSSPYRKQHTARVPSQDAFLFGSEMDPRTVRATMRSCPEGYVREEYSHPSWLPLLKDGYGNYIGIDLDPPILTPDERARLDSSSAPPILPARGQVIAFGREMDTKTVLWNGWGDSNAYDNLGGGGWARFLAGFADDLSASSALHNNRSRNSNNNDRASRHRQSQQGRGGSYGFSSNDADSDEEAYRFSTGGRQEGGPTDRSATGLEWIDSNPVYSGMGTIEALVERSRRIWSSLGMPMPASTPGTETVPLVSDGGGDQQRQRVDGTVFRPRETEGGQGTDDNPFTLMHTGQGQIISTGIDRSHKPPQLSIGSDALPQQPLPGSGTSTSTSPGRSISHPLANASNTTFNSSNDDGLEDVDVSLPSSAAESQIAFIQTSINSGDDSYNDGGVLDDPARSTTALVHPDLSSSQQQAQYRPPLSPEPSLILSPPSPKDNSEMFGPFPSSSSPPPGINSAVTGAESALPRAQTPVGDANGRILAPVTPLASQQPQFPTTSRNNGVASPTRLSSGDNLYSPSRMSPGQVQRYAEKQRQRTMSGGKDSKSPQQAANTHIGRQARRPPPPVMPLGLPTLEFGNGIWGEFDTGAGTGAYGYEKDSFEVVIDGPRR